MSGCIYPIRHFPKQSCSQTRVAACPSRFLVANRTRGRRRNLVCLCTYARACANRSPRQPPPQRQAPAAREDIGACKDPSRSPRFVVLGRVVSSTGIHTCKDTHTHTHTRKATVAGHTGYVRTHPCVYLATQRTGGPTACVCIYVRTYLPTYIHYMTPHPPRSSSTSARRWTPGGHTPSM